MGDPTPQASRRRKLPWLAILLAGLLTLAATLVLTAKQVADADQRGCVPPATSPPPGAQLAVAYNDFRLGQGLCLGVNLPVYFAAARATPRSDAPRIATLQVYFGTQATPATLMLDIDAPGNASARWAGWTWRKVLLRPASTADSAAGRQWRSLLTEGGVAPKRPIIIGVATRTGETAPALPRAQIPQAVTLEVINPWLTTLGAFGILAIAAGIVMACWDTGLLRDRAPIQGSADNPVFSLGRVQMAMWLVLSVSGFLAIWLITGARTGIITPGVLTLLGISGISGLAARMIDVANPLPDRAQSAGFFRDIVSEGYGEQRSVAVHRLQMLAWTLILGMIFVWSVSTSFAFPDFDTNLLLLMGISSGTYIGFKFPESASGAASE